MADDPADKPLSRLERIAAFWTLTDTDLLPLCHMHKRQEVVHEFFMLCAMSALNCLIWFVTMTGIGVPWYGALAMGCLAPLIIALFDVGITASDTGPRGILREAGAPGRGVGRNVARLVVSLLLGLGTAVGVDIYIMKEEALKITAREVDTQNAPVIADYEAKLDDLYRREVTPAEERLAKARKRLDGLDDELAGATGARDSALAAARAQELERARQVDGLAGRSEGNGVLARDAARQRDLAESEARLSEDRKRDLAAERPLRERGVAAAEKGLDAARSRFDAKAAELARQRDGLLAAKTDGPMTVVKGWWMLWVDPEMGIVVHLTTAIAFITMMALELAFFMRRVVFKGASIYDARLNTRIRTEAVQLAAGLAAEVAQARGRPPLRVVGRDDDRPAAPPDGPNGDVNPDPNHNQRQDHA